MPERKARLEGKVAVVSGAGSRGAGIGNGKAAAVLFAREGARVLLVDQFSDRVNETLEIIRSEGGQAAAFVGDVTRLSDCQEMVKSAVSTFGKLDILHNNVGIDSVGTVVDIDLEDWDRVMEVNLRSIVLTSRCAIPRMAAGGGGAISSSLVTRLAPHWTARSPVRFWLQAMTGIPKALPTAAILDPRLPSPISPRTLPFRSAPTVVCQFPCRTELNSWGMWRKSPIISPQANSAVVGPPPRVPHTRIPKRVAAARSIELFRMPVVTRRCSAGN